MLLWTPLWFSPFCLLFLSRFYGIFGTWMILGLSCDLLPIIFPNSKLDNIRDCGLIYEYDVIKPIKLIHLLKLMWWIISFPFVYHVRIIPHGYQRLRFKNESMIHNIMNS